jgi:hypothetical protein
MLPGFRGYWSCCFTVVHILWTSENKEQSYMRTHFSDRWRHALVTGVVAILGFLATSPVIGLQSGRLFTGAGFGPTPEVTIQQATWDAQISAEAEQLFSCEQIGEPSIFPGPDPESGRNFSAEVTLECTP